MHYTVVPKFGVVAGALVALLATAFMLATPALKTTQLAQAAPTSARKEACDPIDEYLLDSLRDQHIPGLSLAIIRGGEVIKNHSYGLASLELQAEATNDTVYELASTTKPLVAIAILLLQEQGSLKIDDPVSKYVKGLPEDWSSISLRHLLTHTSGIKDYVNDLGKNFPHTATAQDVIEFLKDKPLNFRPGEKWMYSNSGYVLLGAVIEATSGRSYDEFLATRVFGPLGMTTARRDSADQVVANRATGYTWLGGTFRNAEYSKGETTNLGDRGILITAGDLARLHAAISTNKILSPKSRDAMWTPVTLNDGSRFGYGLGWFLGEIQGRRHYCHAGGAPGASAIISHYPDDDSTIVVLANGGAAYPQGLQLGVARHCIDALKLRKSSVAPEILESYTGYYNIFSSQLLTVTKDDDSLLVSDGNGFANRFVATNAGARFSAIDANRSFTVTMDAEGRPSQLNVLMAPIEFSDGGIQESARRIGPLAEHVEHSADAEPSITRQLERVLMSLAKGGEKLKVVEGLAPGARQDFSLGPVPELIGLSSVAYVNSFDVSIQSIERHHTPVSRVVYLKIVRNSEKLYAVAWLTEDGSLADIDVLGAVSSDQAENS